MEQSSFGYWLRLRRKALDLTREGLADRVGYSAETIRKIETEQRRPSAEMAERLAEIFNIPPQEQTAFLRFARGDWKFAPSEIEEEFPWQVSVKSHRSNLPATVTSFVGREQEISLARKYLLDSTIRLVSLVGPPGIGKTRLSLETARTVLSDFPNGVFFVALAPPEDPSLLALTVAQALGLIARTHPLAIEQLTDGIRDKQMLIVLDNCEHLIEDAAALALELLSACPRLKILVTSRESLRIPGEWIYTIPALNVPKEGSSVDVETVSEFPALTLFSERARAVRSDFTLDSENLQSIVAICAQLDGLPLAIELIAARMRLMLPQALLNRLSGQFVLTADGMRAASARQKTLNDAIGWSYDLLSAEEQKCFAYLSVFSGGFTLDAAEAIFSRTVKVKSVSELVTSLLDKSLLQRVPDREARGEPRYTMLVTIQEFARARLRERAKETVALNWHLAYFLDLAEKGNAEIRGPNQIEWLHRLDVMRDNFRTALQWAIETGRTEAALGMARKLHWFHSVRGDHSEGRQWLGRVLALPDAPLYPGAYAEALTQIALDTWLQIGAEKARPFVEQALAVARAHDEKWNTAYALSVLGLVLNMEHNFVQAQVALEESKKLFQEVDDDWGYAHAIMCQGNSAYQQDDHPTSLRLHEQGLELFHKLGDRYFQSVALRLMSDVHVKQGNWSLAQTTLREALILAQQLDSKYEIGACIWSLGYAVQPSVKVVRAVHLYGAARNLLDSVGAWSKGNIAAFENDIAPCRAALSEEEFAEALEQGSAMTMEQAIAYALEFSTDQ